MCMVGVSYDDVSIRNMIYQGFFSSTCLQTDGQFAYLLKL